MATAQQILADAYTLIGVLGLGDTLPAEQASYGLRQLNALVASFKAQNLTALAVQRAIFPLQDGKQTYFIGPGAELNISRPQAIVGASLFFQALGSPVSAVSVTRTDFTATVTQTAHGRAVNDQVFVYGQTCDPAYNGVQVVTAIPTADTWTYTMLENAPSPAVGTVSLYSPTDLNTQLEIPIAVLTTDMWRLMQLKGMENPLFTQLYYQPTQPFGTVFLWPRPNTNENQLVLYLQTQFDGFASLTRDYTWADTPGYYDLLQASLAVKLAPAFPGLAEIGPLLMAQAQALRLVKRQNLQLSDGQNDAALSITGNARYGYSINSGNIN